MPQMPQAKEKEENRRMSVLVIVFVGIFLLVLLYSILPAKSSIHPKQLEGFIAGTLCHYFGSVQKNEIQLLVMTIAHESHGGTYLKQLNGGPARGILQMEPKTEWDIFINFVRFRADLLPIYHKVNEGVAPDNKDLHQQGNLVRQVVMARLHYLRVPKPIPPAGNVWAMADYIKTYWNTKAGSATTAVIVANYYNYLQRFNYETTTK